MVLATRITLWTPRADSRKRSTTSSSSRSAAVSRRQSLQSREDGTSAFNAPAPRARCRRRAATTCSRADAESRVPRGDWLARSFPGQGTDVHLHVDPVPERTADPAPVPLDVALATYAVVPGQAAGTPLRCLFAMSP